MCPQHRLCIGCVCLFSAVYISLSEKNRSNSVSPAAYVVPIVVLIIAMVVVGIVLLVIIRTKKRKRVRGHLSQIHSPVPTVHGTAFHKKNDKSLPVSMSSPMASVACNDPLEFPRNRLYVYTKKVLGGWVYCTTACMYMYVCDCIERSWVNIFIVCLQWIVYAYINRATTVCH